MYSYDQGRFEIISFSGSYVRTELGGRSGGLSVCLSSSDGQMIGGGVNGPLKAAGPVQVLYLIYSFILGSLIKCKFLFLCSVGEVTVLSDYAHWLKFMLSGYCWFICS